MGLVFVVWLTGVLMAALGLASTLHPPTTLKFKLWYWGSFSALVLAGLVIAIYQQDQQDAKDQAQADSNNSLAAEVKTANVKLDALASATGITISGGLNEKLDYLINHLPQPRHLSPEQRMTLITELKAAGSYTIAVRSARLNSEMDSYADEFKSALKEAGWNVVDPDFLLGESAGHGVQLLFKDSKNPPSGALELQDVLRDIGVNAPAAMNDFTTFKNSDMELYIGYP